MAKLSIITAPDPRLKLKAKPVGRVDDAVRRLMDDMLETMYAAPGIGLAAPQVGVLQRVIVLDLAPNGEPPQPLRIADPEIVWVSDDDVVYEEGCLSVPEIFDEVERPAKVRLRYLNYQGEAVEEEAEGLYAVCIQHEMDHLNGVLFIDHLSRLKRDRAVAKVKKQQTAA